MIARRQRRWLETVGSDHLRRPRRVLSERSLALIGLLLVLGAGAWRSAESTPSHLAVDARSNANAGAERSELGTQPRREHQAKLAPYPPAAWRLADPNELARVVLWVSHILIRHDASKNLEVSFSLADWSSVAPSPARSRTQALELAREVATKAEAGDFAALAREYSEDITTRDQGGSLGGITASQLLLWPQVLDALAAISEGEISRVVETRYGFHVFARSRPVFEQAVSGSRIVIGHARARWLGVVRSDVPPQRSREDALALATEVFEQARAQPEDFERLVARYSEHPDALEGGDFGSWSTREPSPFPREIEVLRSLDVGKVAAPIDSPFGFEIIIRTPERPREQFAMTAIRLPFERNAPADQSSSRASSLARARSMARRVAEEPAAFAALQEESCCRFVEQWPEGRGSPVLTAALRGLEIGRVAEQPMEAEASWVIPRRLAPRPVESLPTRFALPAPYVPDLAFHIPNLPPQVRDAQLQRVAKKARAALGLTGATWDQFLKLHEPLPLDPQHETSDMPAKHARRMEAVQQLLGDEPYARYVALVQRHFAELLLTPSESPH